jgi:hypothetical protein
MLIRRTQSGFVAQTLARGANAAASDIHRSPMFGAALQYAGAGFFDSKPRWRHLRAAGWEDIPGGDIGVARADLVPRGRISNLSSIGRTLVYGRERLFLYDGNTMTEVPDSGPDRIGTLPRVHDLPSIGRAFVVSDRTVFQITAEGLLTQHTMPFSFEDTWTVNFSDWPEAGVGAVSAPDGVFIIKRDLEISLMSGTKRNPPLGFGSFPVGTHSGTGDLMIFSGERPHLIIDKAHGDAAACEAVLRDR